MELTHLNRNIPENTGDTAFSVHHSPFDEVSLLLKFPSCSVVFFRCFRRYFFPVKIASKLGAAHNQDAVSSSEEGHVAYGNDWLGIDRVSVEWRAIKLLLNPFHALTTISRQLLQCSAFPYVLSPQYFLDTYGAMFTLESFVAFFTSIALDTVTFTFFDDL